MNSTLIYRFPIACIAFVVFIACGSQVRDESTPRNVYTIDENNPSRRRDATSGETNMLVVTREGCGGALIRKNIVVTVAHCPTNKGDYLTSGVAWNSMWTRNEDLLVEQVLEENKIIDYKILLVSWPYGFRKGQYIASRTVTQSSDVAASRELFKGEALFNVGIPFDRGVVTFAAGNLKEIKEQSVAFDIGVTSGNSGSPIFRRSDNALVGLVTGGTRSYGQTGWTKNDNTRSWSWNSGVPMWVIYENSKALENTRTR